LTGGAAAGVAGAIASSALSGAVIGAGSGAVIGGISSVANGGSFAEGASDGFMWGAIGGGITGGTSGALSSTAVSSTSSALNNPLVKNAVESGVDTTVNTVDDLAHGRDVSVTGIVGNFVVGTVSGLNGNKTNNSANITDTEIIWPNKPHTNKTEGHWETIVDKTQELAESGEYKRVYVNKGIRNEVPNVTPNTRADITGVRKDNAIDLFEVPSKTDDPQALLNRMKNTQSQLGERSGNSSIVNIQTKGDE